MNIARLDGVDIAYIDEGEGEPILLIHGFASSVLHNWVNPGWVKALVNAGRRVIALDNRGHGRSQKFYQPGDYEPDIVASDSSKLLDYLDIREADVMGYSMGARLTAFLAMAESRKVRRAIFGGLGENMIAGVGNWQPVAAALEAETVEEILDPTGRAFRLFADQTGSDRRALAACIRPSRLKISAEDVAQIQCPALVAVGENDEIGGPAEGLAKHLPKGETFVIPGRDHMKAVGDKHFKARVLKFLETAN